MQSALEPQHYAERLQQIKSKIKCLAQQKAKCSSLEGDHHLMSGNISDINQEQIFLSVKSMKIVINNPDLSIDGNNHFAIMVQPYVG